MKKTGKLFFVIAVVLAAAYFLWPSAKVNKVSDNRSSGVMASISPAIFNLNSAPTQMQKKGDGRPSLVPAIQNLKEFEAAMKQSGAKYLEPGKGNQTISIVFKVEGGK